MRNGWKISDFIILLIPFFNTEGKKTVIEAFFSGIELSKFRI